MKGWFITGIVVTAFYFFMGIMLSSETPLYVWILAEAIIALIGIILYTRRRYKVTKILWIISGIMSLPFGILLIIAGIQIGKLER